MKGFINYKIMKKFVLAFCLPVLTAASLIGAGYATWYFDNNTQSSDPLTVSAVVTNKASLGEYSSSGSAKLFLDQDKLATDDGLNVNRHGVTWKTSATTEETLTDNTNTADLKLTYSLTTGNLPDDGKTTIEIVTTFTYSSDFKTYLNFNISDTDNNFAIDNSITDKVSWKCTRTINEAGNFTLFDITKVSVSYNNTIDLTTYGQMKNALDNKEFKVESTATLKVKA